MSGAEHTSRPCPSFTHLNVIAASYGQLGDGTNAEAALAELLKIDPDYGTHVTADLAKRGVSPGITWAIIDCLVKAGLHVPPAPTSD